MDADHRRTSAHGLLGRHGTDNGVVAVNRGGHTAAQTRGDTAAIRHNGKGRVAQIGGHEEVLVRGGTGERGNRGNERVGGIWRRPVRYARNISDWNDV